MTDPVDTAALRTAGRMIAPGFPGVDKAMDTAADEVDRLRAELMQAQQDVTDAENDGIGWMDRANRLRAVIENAPHDESVCDVPTALLERMTVPCTCWKADAL